MSDLIRLEDLVLTEEQVRRAWAALRATEVKPRAEER